VLEQPGRQPRLGNGADELLAEDLPTAAEEVVAGIWTTLLKRERVGIDDGFFDIGGDSLLATRVVARVRAEFEIDFPLRRPFTGPTVRELAAAVEEILVRRIETMDEGEAARQLEERAAHGKEDGAR